MKLRARDSKKSTAVCEPGATLQTRAQYWSITARTVARISHVPQNGSQATGKKAAALIFAHLSGMVNVIARGPGSKGHSRVSQASASGA